MINRIRALQTLPHRILAYLENEDIPLIHFFWTFIAIILLRDFLESFSQASTNYLNLNPLHLMINLIHFALGFATIAASLTLLFYFATGEKIAKILRVIIVGFLLILLSPPLDLLASLGHGQDMLYLGMTESSDSLITLLLTFYKGYSGVTTGIKIELAIAMFMVFSYCWLKGRNILFSLIYTILAYLIIFTFSAAPILIHYVFSLLHLPYQFSSLLMLRFYLIVLFCLGVPILYLANPQIFRIICKDMRWLRILHYWLTFCLGASLAMANALHNGLLFGNQVDLFIINFIFCSISIVCVGLFTIVENNIYDQAIDKISNSERPLITQKISLTLYQKIGYAALAIALMYAFAAGYRALFLMSVVIANYYLYSVPPLRLKRIFMLSKLIIAINFLVILILGYSLLADSIRLFPSILFPIFLIGFTLCANFIDMKDQLGDQANGIKTIVTCWSASTVKLFLSCVFLLTYLSFYLIINENNFIFLIFLCVIASLQIYFLNTNKFNEKFILLINNISATTLVIFLLTQNVTLAV